MNEEKRLEKAYRDLQESQTPDLWQRIEANLEPRKARMQEEDQTGDTYFTRRKPIWSYGIAGALACFCLILAMWIFKMPGSRQAGPIIASETKAPVTDWEEAGSYSNENARNALWYQELPVYGTEAAPPPEDASFLAADAMYFTEDILGQTDLLCMAEVQSVTYEASPDNNTWEAVYDIVIDQTLYANDSRNHDLKSLKVRAPLVDDGEGKPLYLMKEGGLYVVPLQEKDGFTYLSFAFAPQIEVTEDHGYVFHTGWKSLTDQQTAVVFCQRQADGDFYFDRMVYREDNQFLCDLTALIQALHNG